VTNHSSATVAKLRVADRAEALIRARPAGLGTPSSTTGALTIHCGLCDLPLA